MLLLLHLLKRTIELLSRKNRNKKMVGQYKKQLDVMMLQEISRADFLKFTGAAVLGLIGVVGFFKNLNGLMTHTTDKSGGYGRSVYGR